MEQITEKNFDEFLQNNKLVVIDFWASWCGPCRMMAPHFEKISEELSSKYVFAKCNIDDNEGLALKLNIYSIPTVVVFENGKEIARNIGFSTSNDLKSRLKLQN